LRDKWLEEEFHAGVGEGVGESTVLVLDVVVEPLILVQLTMAFASARRCPFVAVPVAASAESKYDDKMTMYIPITSLQCANVEGAYMVQPGGGFLKPALVFFCSFL
jgi:hypothetical protein